MKAALISVSENGRELSKKIIRPLVLIEFLLLAGRHAERTQGARASEQAAER